VQHKTISIERLFPADIELGIAVESTGFYETMDEHHPAMSGFSVAT
jgi:hypothetical protein